MPLNFGGIMKKLDEKLTKSGATMPDNLGLSDHTSKWNMDKGIHVVHHLPEMCQKVW